MPASWSRASCASTCRSLLVSSTADRDHRRLSGHGGERPDKSGTQRPQGWRARPTGAAYLKPLLPQIKAELVVAAGIPRAGGERQARIGVGEGGPAPFRVIEACRRWCGSCCGLGVPAIRQIAVWAPESTTAAAWSWPPNSNRRRDGRRGARTRRRRTPGPASGSEPPRCGRAFPHCAGRWTPSTSWSSGTSRHGPRGSGAAAPC